MTIQPIGAESVALYLTPADLREHGLTPEGITQEVALTLTRGAFAQAGIAVEGPVEIEAYPDLWGVLVFARLQPPKQAWFTFGSLEELLTAARGMGPLRPDASLLWCDGVYWLSLPAAAEQALCRLSEFGVQAQPAPYLDARLSEHGKTLISGGALRLLLDYFPGGMA